MNTQKVSEDEQIVSFDVTALFTSVPVDLAMEITKRKLSGTYSWKYHTNLSQDEILDLLSFVLSNSYFTFEEKHYHQISGCAMGSPLSAVIAELVMQDVEMRAINPSPVSPKWWQRDVDDSSACHKDLTFNCFISTYILSTPTYSLPWNCQLPRQVGRE